MVTENTVLQNLFKQSKSTVKLFQKYGLYCPSCKGAAQDTVRIAAVNHGLNIDNFLRELNEAAKDKDE